MTGFRKRYLALGAACLLSVSLVTAGCRSSHVEIAVENRTGEAIQLLEVAYPRVSAGADSLAPSAGPSTIAGELGHSRWHTLLTVVIRKSSVDQR